ncbi:MAG: insulinase family protein, partial [Proteobacteria bacterium]|nr:insulinase family protein [Pseudomonadota bacterium]
TRATLENGLTVMVLEDHRVPTVSVGLAVRRGAGSESLAEAGVAALVAELMKQGAGDQDALELARAVDTLGATLSVSASWDSLEANLSGLSRDLDALMAILRDVVLAPRFERGEARRTVARQLDALAKAEDDPQTLVVRHTQQALYAGHRYGEAQSGTRASVGELDGRAARRFHARVFVPGNAVLYASGDLDAERFVTEARRAFGAWQQAPVPEPTPAPPAEAPAAPRIVVVDKPELAQARIVVAHEGVARSDPDRIALDLVNSVLGGGGFSSRLMRILRAEEGLTYGVYSGFSLRRRPGPFLVSTFTRVPETRRALDLVIAELQRIQTEPPSQDELARAASNAVGRFGLGLETSAAVLRGLVSLDLYGLPEDSLDTYRARVRAVDTAEAARVARAHLHPERLAIVLLGPASQLVPQLEGLGPVEVVEP